MNDDDYNYPTYDARSGITKQYKEGGKTEKNPLSKGGLKSNPIKVPEVEVSSELSDKGVFSREYYIRLRDLKRKYPGDKEAQNKAARESLEKAYNKKYKKKKKKKKSK